MKITSGLRKKLNKIATKYSKWLYPNEIKYFYDEIAELGVEVPMWSAWDEGRGHRYYIDGEEVENSLLVFSKYEGTNSPCDEYNIYFS